jgi:phage terminase large subunit
MFIETTATRKIKALTKRIKAVPGGTSASKTISIELILIGLAQSDYTCTVCGEKGCQVSEHAASWVKEPVLTSIVSESLPHLKRGAIRDFLKIMREHGYYDDAQWNRSDFIYTFETGSQIEFFSADQPDKLRGARRQRLYINEANNVSFDAFEQLEVRTSESVWLDWNPSAEFWFYTDVLGKRDDVDMLTVTYLDNEALDARTVASIEQRKNRPEWWKVYGLGQLGEVEGRIYTGWKLVDDIPHEARLKAIGLDFGYTNDPTAAVAIYEYNGGLIFDEILYRKGMSNKAIADALGTYKNALVIADSAEPKSIDELKSYGVNVIPASKGAGSVNQGIGYIQDTACSITKRSTETLKEYRNYLWLRDRSGKVTNNPQDYDNHALDAIRYGSGGRRAGKLFA